MNGTAAGKKWTHIDPTAIVHPSATLGEGVSVGPYSVIHEDVRIGKNTSIGPHVVIDKWTTIGERCNILQFVSIGAPPQDFSYKGEKTEVIIGDNNTIREFVTIHRATTKDKGRTVCGNNNLFMNYVHIAHDCAIGSNIVMANSATLGGHVAIDDYAIVGGIVAVHQYVRIGAYSIIGGASAVSKDIPPYVMAVGNRAHVRSLNKVGIRRQGFSKAELDEIKASYDIIFKASLGLKAAIARLTEAMPESAHAKRYIDFLKSSKRGIAKLRGRSKDDAIDDKDF